MEQKTEYIDRKAAIDEIDRVLDRYYSADDDKAAEAGDDCRYAIEKTPAADVAPVVRCKNCIYWKDRHIKLDDGTERPYTEEELQEFCGMVPLSIGINVSSYCTRVELEDTNFWCGPDDFCSKGARMD